MILNVSGRTDIIAFYSNWFIKRLEAGFVDVRNPFYPKQISRIYFSDVDAMVFCTKNPLPIIDYLPKIRIPIIFHVTLTPYKKDLEPNVIPKGRIVDGIKKISTIIGQENIYVRYDPIIINDKYTLNYHIKAFDNLCKLLDNYVKHIIVSFVDDYKNVRHNKDILKIKKLSNRDYKILGENFSRSAKEHGMTVQTCCEEHNLVEYGFIKKDCVDAELMYKKINKTNFKIWKERPCHCISMVDIGFYNTCSHFCKYCYANYDEQKVNENVLKHDVNSSLIVGKLEKDDIIKVRKK